MRPSMFMGGSSLRPATCVGSAFAALPYGNRTVDIDAIPGALIGDYAFIVCASNQAPTYFSATASGWNTDNFTFSAGYRTTVLHRQIDSLKMAIRNPAGSDSVPAGMMIAIYRGASRATRQSVVSETSSAPLTVPGFTRNSDCVGVLSLAITREDDMSTMTPSTGFTRRAIGSPGLFSQAFADALLRANYVDGAAMTWNGSINSRMGALYEMRL